MVREGEKKKKKKKGKICLLKKGTSPSKQPLEIVFLHTSSPLFHKTPTTIRSDE